MKIFLSFFHFSNVRSFCSLRILTALTLQRMCSNVRLIVYSMPTSSTLNVAQLQYSTHTPIHQVQRVDVGRCQSRQIRRDFNPRERER